MRVARGLLGFFAGIVLVLSAVLLMAPTGGFPARPTFQAVTIRQATTGSGDDVFLQLRDTDTGNADGGTWRLTPQQSGAQDCLDLTTYTDALVLTDVAISLCRSGATIDTVNVGGLLTNGGVSIARVTSATSAPSGAGMRVGDTIRVKKAADTSRASTITPTADPHLQVTGLPSGVYSLRKLLIFSSGAGGDRTQIDVSSATQMNGNGVKFCTTGGATAFAQGEGNAQTCAGVSSSHRGATYVTEPASSGTIAVLWAQNTSDAANTTLLSQSWIEVTRLD